MKLYDAECPVCGRINRGLYLEETKGWMECEACGNEVNFRLSLKRETAVPQARKYSSIFIRIRCEGKNKKKDIV